MKKFFPLVLVPLAVFLLSGSANAQIAVTVDNPTNTTPNLAASYTSLANAITAINGVDAMTGPVTFSLAAGGTETAPTGGYLLGSATLNAVTSATNTISFIKSGVGANPLITAFTPGASTTVDGIWKIQGTDYVTITSIDLQENASNTTAEQQMEWGYAIVKLSASDGSQNINITGCTVTLNKENTVSVGIYGGNHTATDATTLLGISSAAGTNANIKINNNVVSNAYNPIYIAGSITLAYYDTGLEIGTTTGNTVSNYGGGASTTYGIYITGQNAPKIENNSVTLGTGTTATAYGINVASACIGYLKINVNTVSVSSSATVSTLAAINNSAPIATTLDITNNIIQNCSYTTATTGIFYGIAEQGATTGCTVNITGNTVTGTNYSAAGLDGLGNNYYIYETSSGTPSAVNVNNNYIYNNTKVSSATSGVTQTLAININKGTSQTANNNQIYNNTINGSAGPGGQFFGIVTTAGGTVEVNSNQIYNNQINKTTGGASLNAIYSISAGTTETYNGNTIYGNTHAGTGSVYGIYKLSGTTVTISNNTIHDLSTATTTNAIYGIYKSTGTTVTISNNTIYNLSNTYSTSATVSVYGISFPGPTVTGTSNIYGNFIHSLSINSGNTSTVAKLFGILLDNTATAGDGASVVRNVYNNIISLGNGVNNNCRIYGIQDTNTAARTNNIYFNTVYIAGSPNGNTNTMSFIANNSSLDVVRNIRNNVFVNARSRTGGTGKHYSAYFVNTTGLTIDYNDYYVSGTGGTIGYWPSADITSWPDANLGANSLNVNPNFVFTLIDAGGTTPNEYQATNSSLKGVGVHGTGITTDFSGYTRPNPPSIGGIENDNPLPIELNSFISNVNGRNIKLIWITASEINNSGFDVERAVVKNQNLEFIKIGFVQGKGAVNTSTNYSFEDRNLQTGKYMYRLKQIDVNGNFEYFNLSNSVEVGIPTKFDISQNYPNPFNPVTKIDFSLPLDSKVSIKLYDISGREIKTLVNDSRTAGYYTVQFNASDLSSGTYFYRIMTKSSAVDYNMTKKMMLIK